MYSLVKKFHISSHRHSWKYDETLNDLKNKDTP